VPIVNEVGQFGGALEEGDAPIAARNAQATTQNPILMRRLAPDNIATAAARLVVDFYFFAQFLAILLAAVGARVAIELQNRHADQQNGVTNCHPIDGSARTVRATG